MRLLAQMMAAEGYDVCSWELTGAPNERALCDALKADIIVLPLPAEKNGYLSGTELTMESLLRSLRREHRIFAGNVGNDASTLAQSLGLTITDYFASEELSVRNAIPTAEGAIEAAMKHTSVTLHGTPCLVLGFGRIGKVLAHDLSALGAKVSVSARKRSDLAWIDAFGYAPLHTNRLSGTLGEFRVVFNTVPHQVLDEALLAELPPDCLLIELASASGFDMDAVETLRLSYLKAGGLPGRVAPETAARAIKKTLCRLIKEEA
jgi:dipicolinate synthase subunit A